MTTCAKARSQVRVVLMCILVFGVVVLVVVRVWSSKQLRKNREEQLRKAKRSEQWLERRLGERCCRSIICGFRLLVAAT